MKIELNDQNSEDSNCNKGKEICSSGGDTKSPWPYRVKLTPDSMRWDSLKISPSREFEDIILQNISAASHKALETWQPIEISIYDVDTHETYKVHLAKKESFWFEPLPDIGQKQQKSATSGIITAPKSSYESKEMIAENFAYSLQPFRHIVKKRGLSYDQEIGLNWSGNRIVNNIDFSVLQAPRFGLQDIRF
ncbi:conserved hypothetical protein [Ricinus communis]|uniref:Uncharacterized protein n=1 Tax=Ricinus communis TaxID=3988 RepID=B9RF43_RICCO|nr:conserved hypothetical protein [Ricinus communis]